MKMIDAIDGPKHRIWIGIAQHRSVVGRGGFEVCDPRGQPRSLGDPRCSAVNNQQTATGAHRQSGVENFNLLNHDAGSDSSHADLAGINHSRQRSLPQFGSDPVPCAPRPPWRDRTPIPTCRSQKRTARDQGLA
jgi:hypothetical protein